MSILTCAAEDIDFPNGTTPSSTGISGTAFRANYARTGLFVAATNGRTLPLPAGAVTSCWLHAQIYDDNVNISSSYPVIGMSLNSAGNGAGIYIGASAATYQKAAILKFDGTTVTDLAAESTNAFSGLHAYDLNIVSYGATSTLTLYRDQVQIATFSGSSAISGVANLDCIALMSNTHYLCSEMIVATTDSRNMALVTCAPNGAGAVNNWSTGTYADINPVTINDANFIGVNATAQDFQADIIDLPTGIFTVAAVKIIARSEIVTPNTPTQLELGVQIAGTVYVGTAKTLTTGMTSYEELMLTNPHTGVAWAQSDINSLQMDLRSA